jgi:hypothetical protein
MADSRNVEREIQAACEKELALIGEALAITEEVLRANEHKLRRSPGTGSAEAVSGLFAKGWKTIHAIRLLAEQGYGQDALILLRSLVNLTIDLAYICASEPEKRVAQWIAYAQMNRRRLASEVGRNLPEEAAVDWKKIEHQSHTWDGLKLKGRADSAGLQNFYGKMYRFGSMFEHPDAWGASTYIEENQKGVTLNVEPSPLLTCSAIGGSLLCLGVAIECLGKFFEFDFGAHFDRLRRLLEALSRE